MRRGARGEGGTGTSACEESQVFPALDQQRALTSKLMEEVCDRDNLNRAYKRVRANKGSPGVDKMTIHELVLDPTFSESSAPHRNNGFQLGANYTATYYFDSKGRFERITDPGLPDYGVQYCSVSQ